MHRHTYICSFLCQSLAVQSSWQFRQECRVTTLKLWRTVDTLRPDWIIRLSIKISFCNGCMMLSRTALCDSHQRHRKSTIRRMINRFPVNLRLMLLFQLLSSKVNLWSAYVKSADVLCTSNLQIRVRIHVVRRNSLNGDDDDEENDDNDVRFFIEYLFIFGWGNVCLLRGFSDTRHRTCFHTHVRLKQSI